MNSVKLLAVVAAASVAASAHAVQIRLGDVSPASPANFSQELAFVNTLIDLANGLTLQQSTYDVPGKNYTVTSGLSATLPRAIATGPLDVEDWNSGVSLPAGSGYSYLLGKYGNTSVVFYSDNGEFNIGDRVPGLQQSISHYTAFRAVATQVPDSGSTATMLGLGVALLGAVRLKRS